MAVLLYPIPVEGHFRHFHALATASKAAVNIGGVFKFGGRHPEEGLLGHVVALPLIF